MFQDHLTAMQLAKEKGHLNIVGMLGKCNSGEVRLGRCGRGEVGRCGVGWRGVVGWRGGEVGRCGRVERWRGGRCGRGWRAGEVLQCNCGKIRDNLDMTVLISEVFLLVRCPDFRLSHLLVYPISYQIDPPSHNSYHPFLNTEEKEAAQWTILSPLAINGMNLPYI